MGLRAGRPGARTRPGLFFLRGGARGGGGAQQVGAAGGQPECDEAAQGVPGDVHRTPYQGRSDVVRDTGIEPVTSSVSGKRSPAELIARVVETGGDERGGDGNRTRVQGFAGPCLSHSATPPQSPRSTPRADDGIRTRDPNLGKVVRYQLRYIRTRTSRFRCVLRLGTVAEPGARLQTGWSACAGGEQRDQGCVEVHLLGLAARCHHGEAAVEERGHGRRGRLEARVPAG
jgi:hypothetical protein